MKIATLVLVAAAAGVLVAQNTEVVEFNLLFWRVNMSRIVLLLLAMSIGFVAGVISALLVVRSRRHVPEEAGGWE
ncbi:MAG: LapA family protein [Chloroflexi bacterium]|nr:LapA family protein [Chloroflexota bacterium]